MIVLQLNVWGMNPDGKPDESFVFGDLDNDGVLDRMPPSSLTTTLINITKIPAWPHLGYRVILNDGDYRYGLEGYGSQTQQKIIAVLLWIIPIITGALSIWLFMKSFYAVKFNKVGISESHSLVPLALRRAMKRSEKGTGEKEMSAVAALPMIHAAKNASNIGLDLDAGAKGRRTVLIATMEYDIEDWEIKIKIGGLGVMAQLMGKNLGHQDLIWVVPCVGGIDYPEDQRAEPMHVTILGISYVVEVQYHTLRNITYVLLDAPVFRAQSKQEPYPARMDDLDSAVYYSAWNQCIALAVSQSICITSTIITEPLHHFTYFHRRFHVVFLSTMPSSRVCGQCERTKRRRKSAPSTICQKMSFSNTCNSETSSTCYMLDLPT
jgi:alpha-1,3-glucan synthase